VRSAREECLDRLTTLNERHLRRVLSDYVAYYNARQPHQGIGLDSPLGLELASPEGSIRYRNVLGGIIRDCYREAACPSFTRGFVFDHTGNLRIDTYFLNITGIF
jgi:putative transposase